MPHVLSRRPLAAVAVLLAAALAFLLAAKVHLFVSNGTANGPAIYPTGGSWTETGLTWTNQPGSTGAATDDKGSVAASAFVDYDVTPLVTGDGTYNFVLITPSTDALGVNSREAATNKPTL